MFSDIHKGSIVHVLDTRETPKYYTAAVKEVSLPYVPQRPNTPQWNPLPMQQYVNITIDGSEPWGVPTNLNVVTKDGLTVSTTIDDIKTAVTAAQQESSNAVNSYEKHKANLVAYEEIIRQLDPAYAQAREQDGKIKGIESELAAIKGKLGEVPTLSDIKALFEKSQTPKTEKK